MDYRVDALGDICPIPIIKAERKLQEIKAQDRVILETDHNCSLASVTNHFATKYGYRADIIEIEEGVWQIIIEKN